MKAAALIGALTVSLHTLFLFSLSLPTAHAHHVVFEEIGEMAGALSYIHVVGPVNISGLLQLVADFCSKILVLKTNYADTAVYTKGCKSMEEVTLTALLNIFYIISDDKSLGSWTY